jgi:hypothetical protein
MCDDLRIYNPIVSNCELSIKKIQNNWLFLYQLANTKKLKG